MRIRLVLGKTEWAGAKITYPAIKTIVVDIPLEKQDGWKVIGAEWDNPELLREVE